MPFDLHPDNLEEQMGLRLTILATAAILLPVAAAAQSTPPTQPSVPDEPMAGQSQTAPGQTQTTPGQSQAMPGEASQMTPPQTGQTPSSQASGKAEVALTKVTAADLRAGVSVYDQKGDIVGKIKSTSSKGAVVDTGSVSVDVPTGSFAKGDKGLVIGMTRAEIEAAAKKKPK
jgi:hypothetical protein